MYIELLIIKYSAVLNAFILCKLQNFMRLFFSFKKIILFVFLIWHVLILPLEKAF